MKNQSFHIIDNFIDEEVAEGVYLHCQDLLANDKLILGKTGGGIAGKGHITTEKVLRDD